MLGRLLCLLAAHGIACKPVDCNAPGAFPLTLERFTALVSRQEHLDPRSSDAVLLLGYGAAGALPHPSASPLSRRAPWVKSAKGAAPWHEPLLGCAICRIVTQELQLAATLASRCRSEDRDELLENALGVVCEHLTARGALGQNERRAREGESACNEFLRPSKRGPILRSLAGGRALVEVRELACRDACGATGSALLEGELPGWPAILQQMLDQDGTPLSATAA